jgi:hypothetical protein
LQIGSFTYITKIQQVEQHRMDDLFKAPGQLNTGSGKKQQTKQSASFLEALREQAKSATTGVANSAVDQLRGAVPNQDTTPSHQSNTQPDVNRQPFNFAEFLKMRENRIRQQERTLQQQRRTETLLFHQKEEQTKKEIEAIKVEIKKIIESTTDVSAEFMAAEQSLMATTVEVGTYQINFFQRIKRILILVRKRLTESKHWLEMFNSRKNQRSYYWNQVQKSGTKYMLSHERTVATQTG